MDIFTKTTSLTLLLALAASGCSLVQQKNLNATAGPTSGVSSSVPTLEGIAGRIMKGVENNANPMAGNFKTVLAQTATNLPITPDPTKATGLEEIPLLVFAACSDITAAAALSVYGVDTSQSLTNSKSALVAAGIRMVNRHVAGLASTDPLKQNVSDIFSKLVDDNATAQASTATTFVSVCLAANSFGVAMTGF